MALVILPDLPLPLAWAERIEKLVGPTLYRHPSGAPWIVGDPAGRALIHARHEALDVVLTGSVIALDEEALAAKVRRVKSIDALDSVAADYVEADTLLLARQPDRLRSQAPVFQTKSLFWTNLDDITVISDDQLPLGSIAGTGIDSAVLVSRLTDAELSFPFSINSIWRDVQHTGLANLPLGDFERNNTWLMLVLTALQLVCWVQTLILDGDLALGRPDTLRYQLFHTAARIVRSGRRVIVRLQADWPWAPQLAAAFDRLTTLTRLPAPAT